MKELKSQFVGALLVILTVTAVICAGVNYQQQARFHLPDDGATWMDVPNSADSEQSLRVVAAHVERNEPADLAGIRKGDVVRMIAPLENTSGVPVRQASDVAQLLFQAGVWGKATYTLNRNGVEITAKVIVADANRDRALYFQSLSARRYLAIGLFLFFRRNQAPKALHFYLLCLVSFILHTFHYTGKLNSFDTGIYIANIVAGLLAPTRLRPFLPDLPGTAAALRTGGRRFLCICRPCR
ncbi:MAG: PDZ domain-containing protein [Paludibaculum sp.]